MRYLVPLESDQGLQSRISSHFGRARLYAIVICEKPGSEARVEMRSAAGSMHESGCGAIDIIENLEVEGIGIRAIQILRRLGVRVYKTSSETLDQVVEELRDGKVREIGGQEACRWSPASW